MIYLCDDDHDPIAHSEDRPRSNDGDCPLCRMRGEMQERIRELDAELEDARDTIKAISAEQEG